MIPGFLMGKRVLLSCGEETIVSEQDYERVVSAGRWTLYVNPSGKKYAKRKFTVSRGIRVTIGLHRFIMRAQDGTHVDHLNGDGLDNRRENLEVVTPRENYERSQRKKREKPFL